MLAYRQCFSLLFVVVLGVVLPSGSARADYLSTVLSSNPLVYYRFSENSTALPALNLGSLGAAQNGTYIGGITLGQPSATAELGNSAFFNGVQAPIGTKVQIPVFHAGNSITAEAWVKLASPYNGTFNAVVARWDGSFELDTDPSRFGNFVVRNNTNTFGLAATNTALDLDTWYHLVGVFDAGLLTVYLNGVPGPGVPLGGTLQDAFPNLWIGATRSGNGANFFGNLDEVAIYGRALTPQEIQQHFAAGIIPEPSSLLLLGLGLVSLFGWWMISRSGNTPALSQPMPQ